MGDSIGCSLLQVLSKLRQSSLESVDSDAEFAEVNEYMHTERDIEKDLKNLLRQVNASGKKSLIILTGSAGDGKSHLISYLKNKDAEHLLEGYTIINDATESDHPSKTAVETLARRIAPFSDQNLHNGDDDHEILAVNLGMLNNFINSSYGEQYSTLRDYLNKIEVFTGSASGEDDPGSPFHTLSFSDYQVFSLKDGTYDDSFLLEVFQKITGENSKNRFYQSYAKCKTCNRNASCPLMANFAFFSRLDVQKVVAFRIIQSVIEEKAIITMREIQNFIYEILVSPEFSERDTEDLNLSKDEEVKNYLLSSLPYLLYKGKSPSNLAVSIRLNDPLGFRNQNQDEELISLYSLNSLEEYAVRISQNTSYRLLTIASEDYWSNLKGQTRSIFIGFMLLLRYSQELKIPSDFSEYIKYLFYYYRGKQASGKSTDLAPLIRLTSRAIYRWYGNFEEDRMCFDMTMRKFWLLEEIDLKLIQKNMVSGASGLPIIHFQPCIELLQSDSQNRVNLDYSLYKLLKSVDQGNNPTVMERNNYVDFDRFIRSIMEEGSLKEKIYILPKVEDQSDKTYTFKFYGDYYTFT